MRKLDGLVCIPSDVTSTSPPPPPQFNHTFDLVCAPNDLRREIKFVETMVTRASEAFLKDSDENLDIASFESASSRTSRRGGTEATFVEHGEKDEMWFVRLRQAEYGYLDEQNQVYLDFTGAALAAKSQLRAFQTRMAGELYGNPHSQSPSSAAATKLVDWTRTAVLEYLHADPSEYAVIFTANATAAAKLVGESYAFGPRRKLVLTFDNHNSINGLREYAKKRRCHTTYVPSVYPDLTIDHAALQRALEPRRRILTRSFTGLFAFPAQSNFSGVRHPLDYVAMAQSRGFDVLLDAAAYVPTNELNLSQVKPEFTIMSWYKMFGFPTGVGCLVARKDALKRLRRPWFSGGTIEAVSVGIPWHRMTLDESAFEDGTLNFHGIPDVLIGLSWVNRIGMSSIHEHVQVITAYGLDRLQQARHSDGKPMIIVYGPATMKHRGGTISFNLLDQKGKMIDERIIAEESADANISLRTGCFCNPGVGENVFQLQVKTLRGLLWSRSPSIDEYIRLLGLSSAGAIRVSFGIASTTRDADALMHFIYDKYRDRITSSEGLASRTRC
ncbi:PLP-dependent transferase [Dissoconium aciculare CBS 342.82]|uniref:PLP-dependent transferase n=1 Tax=Dissoconium aciculare CBS 342.82 TaxID=1314786 RepID=A0A6J3ME17_9PEZI|nr:PLP-dependent transferase [Dissoconium aciculare CBS 342.82]KAF1826255.1 PLP-dependent transferase [Dissoconium aciculare CBS 342.82]